jgi:anhydro-N-acetylmuramic acid kinase
MSNTAQTVLGLMSGTSLDGVDLAICSFHEDISGWKYKVLFAKTFQYDNQWVTKLKNANSLNGRELIELDREYGDLLAQLVNAAIKECKIIPDIISSHGHTIFHTPSKRLTFQIGHGANIAAGTGLNVVCDFRTTDVALGGQGAPLVPLGDKLLFSDYDSCLNIGGFANISFDIKGVRKAFDICPVNIILNELAGKYDKKFDEDGLLGSKGKVDNALLERLNNLEYYSHELPKSLGREWIDETFLPVIDSNLFSLDDKFRTIYQHIAIQMSMVFEEYKIKSALISGGGAYNKFLIKCISAISHTELIIPDKLTIEFKEALIFAFLGLLRYRNSVNTIASVTGAKKDSTGGAIYLA